MPFNVTKAAAHIRRVVIHFERYDQRVTLHYNAGKKYRQYQKQQQKLDQEYNDLNRRLNTEDTSEEAYHELIKAIEVARRRLADNICTVIVKWDLQVKEDISLDDIKAEMSEEDQKEWEQVSGEGDIPIAGAWLDALPLPDEFIIGLRDGIGADFESGGAGGKAP